MCCIQSRYQVVILSFISAINPQQGSTTSCMFSPLPCFCSFLQVYSYLSFAETLYRILDNFRQLLKFTLEIFGKGNFWKQAMLDNFFTAEFSSHWKCIQMYIFTCNYNVHVLLLIIETLRCSIFVHGKWKIVQVMGPFYCLNHPRLYIM